MADKVYLRHIDTRDGSILGQGERGTLNIAAAEAEALNTRDRQCGYSPSWRVIIVTDGFEYDVTDSRYVEAQHVHTGFEAGAL